VDAQVQNEQKKEIKTATCKLKFVWKTAVKQVSVWCMGMPINLTYSRLS